MPGHVGTRVAMRGDVRARNEGCEEGDEWERTRKRTSNGWMKKKSACSCLVAAACERKRNTG